MWPENGWSEGTVRAHVSTVTAAWKVGLLAEPSSQSAGQPGILRKAKLKQDKKTKTRVGRTQSLATNLTDKHGSDGAWLFEMLRLSSEVFLGTWLSNRVEPWVGWGGAWDLAMGDRFSLSEMENAVRQGGVLQYTVKRDLESDRGG